MRSYLPNIYKQSKVMHSLFDAMEKEMSELKNEVTLTESQFFVLLADKNLDSHERDVGLTPNVGDIEKRRSGVLSKLRGTGTTTIDALENVVASYQGGEIEVVEYVSEYAFAIKFISKKGTPTAFSDIEKIVESIKPAHLEVRYIFTYRMWQDVKNNFNDWEDLSSYDWNFLLTFEILFSLNIEGDKVCFVPDNTGNSELVKSNGKIYARKKDTI